MNTGYCEKYSDLIEDLVEDELDEPTAGRVNSHVLACPQCLEEYETLRREKEIYAHYLFDAEPPQDSWADFQMRLVSEKENAANRAVAPAHSRRRSLNVFGLMPLSPAMPAAAVVLILVGCVLIWSKLASGERSVDKNLAETVFRDSPPTAIDLKTKVVDAIDPAPHNGVPPVKNQSPRANAKSLVKGKSPAAETAHSKQESAAPSDKRISLNASRASEEKRLAALRLNHLETEIVGHIEKTEMLLRSFRNARAVGSVETFDVEYERLQARKLLDENRRLRRDAENHGIAFAEEAFGQVEPYLLEIANIEAKPAPEKVLDIKQRVSSQNIIASMQVYCCGGGAQ